jgi:type VI secretion system secreted protein Hcp
MDLNYSKHGTVLKTALMLTLMFFFVDAIPAYAGSDDHFLKIEGIAGESADAKHKDEIDIEAWSWAETQSAVMGQAGGGKVSKVSIEPFRFTTRLSKASPKLMQACASGEHFKKAVLTSRKAGKEQQEYLKITLSDIVISSYSVEAGTTDNSSLTDRISISFEKIEFEYRETKADGTLGPVIKGEWDAGKGGKK